MERVPPLLADIIRTIVRAQGDMVMMPAPDSASGASGTAASQPHVMIIGLAPGDTPPPFVARAHDQRTLRVFGIAPDGRDGCLYMKDVSLPELLDVVRASVPHVERMASLPKGG